MNDTPEFTSTAELVAHYKAVQKRLRALKPPPKEPPRFGTPRPKTPVGTDVPKGSAPLTRHADGEGHPTLSPEPIPLPPTSEWLPSPDAPRFPTPVHRIMAVVAEEFGITVGAMKSAVRTHSLVVPRQVAMYIARQENPPRFGHGLPWLGRQFGGRDHSTVVHAIKKIGERIASDPAFAERIERIRARLAKP
jgi:hypothetical protein